MTRLERKEAELNKLYEFRKKAMEQNNIYWLYKNQRKIAELEQEVSTMNQTKTMSLSEAMKDCSKEVKNNIFKHLLKISLAADYVNECCEQTKQVLKQLDLNDFSLRQEVNELCKLSQKLASFVIVPNQNVLTDMIVDNAEFIDTCDAAANKHLNETLKL